MCRAPRRCAPFTCTSARCSASSITSGSGSVASPSARARNPRSTARTATANGIFSRNASSGTTRISVGEDAPQAALRFGQRVLEMVQFLPVAEAEVVRESEMIPRHEQHVVLGTHPLHDVERADRLAVLHETDGARLWWLPAERVPEAPEPRLEHRVVGPKDAAGAREQLSTHPGLERHGSEVVARP